MCHSVWVSSKSNGQILNKFFQKKKKQWNDLKNMYFLALILSDSGIIWRGNNKFFRSCLVVWVTSSKWLCTLSML